MPLANSLVGQLEAQVERREKGVGEENEVGYWEEEVAAFRKFPDCFKENLLNTMRNICNKCDRNILEWKRKKRVYIY